MLEAAEAVRRPWLRYRHLSRNGFGIFNDCIRQRRCFRHLGCLMSDANSDTVCLHPQVPGSIAPSISDRRAAVSGVA